MQATVGQIVKFRGSPAQVIAVLDNAYFIRFASGAQFTVWPDEISAIDAPAPAAAAAAEPAAAVCPVHAPYVAFRAPLAADVIGADRALGAALEAAAEEA